MSLGSTEGNQQMLQGRSRQQGHDDKFLHFRRDPHPNRFPLGFPEAPRSNHVIICNRASYITSFVLYIFLHGLHASEN